MKTRILMIEDNPDCRQMLGFYLRHLGYDPIEAFDGGQGIYYATNARPELIILDLGLPDMGGMEVLTVLKQDPSTTKTPVVILTAMATDELETKALRAGATDWPIWLYHRQT